jgi:hypothetical protein
MNNSRDVMTIYCENGTGFEWNGMCFGMRTNRPTCLRNLNISQERFLCLNQATRYFIRFAFKNSINLYTAGPHSTKLHEFL